MARKCHFLWPSPFIVRNSNGVSEAKEHPSREKTAATQITTQSKLPEADKIRKTLNQLNSMNS